MHWRSRLPVLAGAAAGVAAGRRPDAAAVVDLPGRRVDRARPARAAAGQRPGARAGRRGRRASSSTAARSPSPRSRTCGSTSRRTSCSTASRSRRRPRARSSASRVEAPSRDEARRTAQELTELSTVLFNDRFGPATVASVWEAPRAQEDRVSPKPVRNLAVGALLGASSAGASGVARPRASERVAAAAAVKPTRRVKLPP